MRRINFKRKKIKFLTKEQWESYENAKICYSFREKFEDKMFCKLETTVFAQVIEVLHTTYVI